MHKEDNPMKFEHINQLCDLVRETSFAIHRYHRHGHVEKIHENALAHRLWKQGLRVSQQHPLKVHSCLFVANLP